MSDPTSDGHGRRPSRRTTSSSGAACSTSWPACSAPASRRCSSCTPRRWPTGARRRSRPLRAAGLEVARAPGARRRGRQDARGRRRLWALLGAARVHPHRRGRRPRRRRGRPTSPASSPPPGCAACRVVHVPTTLLGMVDAAVGGKTGDQHRRGQEPGRRVPPAGRRALRPRRAGDPAAGRARRGLAEVVKGGFIADPRDPRARRGRPGRGHSTPPAPTLRELVERGGRASRPRWSPRTCASPACARSSTTGTRSATPSRRSSGTAGGTARRSSVGLVYAAELARAGGRLDAAAWRGTARCSPRSGCRRPTAGRVARPARRDARRQEGPRRPAALRRPGRHRPAGARSRAPTRPC